MKNKTKVLVSTLALSLILIAGCEPSASMLPQITEQPEQSLANPASENCLKQGGTLTIQERGDGGQYGICYFEDNRQCEEWALYHGDCPVGGLKVTGYITPAAQYCAITGGTYTVTGNSNTENEQGTCSFKDGSQCDVWDYYNGACSPGASESPFVPTGEWQTFTDEKVGFSIRVPPAWTQQTLPDQNEGAIHGVAFTGTEGGVEVYWGVGFGGACVTGTEPVSLAEVEAQACHVTNSDGSEVWDQIGYQVSGGNSFSVRAYTSNSQPSSHDRVLQVLATLRFMPPAQPQVTRTIYPLTVEVCNGQAQAMAYALNVLEVTQSEAPLTDPVNNASGTGCQATVTGTGAQFDSPATVVKDLGSMLAEQGWTEDPMLAAGGPTGMGMGYRKESQICMAAAMWQPDASANCPKDQPVSACQVTPEQQNYTITLNCGTAEAAHL